MSDAILQLLGVGFGYGDRSRLFRGIDLEIGAGEFILVSGPSGVGKTTFLRLLNRLEDAVEGSIEFHGRSLESYDPVRLRQRVVYIQQVPVMVDGTVEENILMPYGFRINRGKPVPSLEMIRERMNELFLDKIGSSDRASSLSLGEQQRVALIRASFLDPEIYLLDEPTSALDEVSRQRVEQFIESRNAGSGATVVMVSHSGYQPRQAKWRGYRFSGGELVSCEV